MGVDIFLTKRIILSEEEKTSLKKIAESRLGTEVLSRYDVSDIIGVEVAHWYGCGLADWLCNNDAEQEIDAKTLARLADDCEKHLCNAVDPEDVAKEIRQILKDFPDSYFDVTIWA